jgi:hypothetical protein
MSIGEHVDVQVFCQGWFREWSAEPIEWGDASELLGRKIWYEPEIAWELILALISAAPDDQALGMVSAGPLEDLLCDHGAAFIDRVEELSRTDLRFRSCLSGVWGWNAMESGVRARLSKAAENGRA